MLRADTLQFSFRPFGSLTRPVGLLSLPFRLLSCPFRLLMGQRGLRSFQLSLLSRLLDELLRFGILLPQLLDFCHGLVRAFFLFYGGVVPQYSKYHNEASQETAGEYRRKSCWPPEVQHQRLNPNQRERNGDVSDECDQVKLMSSPHREAVSLADLILTRGREIR